MRGQHPEVAPDQAGATVHRVGARVMTAAHALHDGVGLPVRKVPAVLQALKGVQLTQSAITQDAMRRAGDVIDTAYALLRASVSQAPVVHTADTGWRVGGEPAYLMTFETVGATVYQPRPQHCHEDVQEVIPPDDAGVMITARGRSDDAQAFDGVDQQKCLAHLLRSIYLVLELKTGRARDFGSSSRPCCRRRWRCGMRTRTATSQASRPKPKRCRLRSPTSCATVA